MIVDDCWETGLLNTVFWPGSVSGQSGRVGQGPNWERRLAGLRGKNRLAMLLNQMGKTI